MMQFTAVMEDGPVHEGMTVRGPKGWGLGRVSKVEVESEYGDSAEITVDVFPGMEEDVKNLIGDGSLEAFSMSYILVEKIPDAS